jgi:nitrite reductase/ring-hydroxylating ferredoxin subunit
VAAIVIAAGAALRAKLGGFPILYARAADAVASVDNACQIGE